MSEIQSAAIDTIPTPPVVPTYGAAAAPDPNIVTLDGKAYRARPFNFRDDYAAAEAYLRAQKKDPLEALVKAISDLESEKYKAVHPAVMAKIKADITDKAYHDLLHQGDTDLNRIPGAEIGKWLDTIDGFAFALWRVLHGNHPELSDVATVRGLILKTMQDEGEKQAMERIKKERDAVANASPGKPE